MSILSQVPDYMPTTKEITLLMRGGGGGGGNCIGTIIMMSGWVLFWETHKKVCGTKRVFL